MPKENRKIVESSSSQRRVCAFDRNQLANVPDDVLQHSPYSIPVAPASRGPSVLAQSKRKQQQGPEGAPHLVPSASAGNEGPSTLSQEV